MTRAVVAGQDPSPWVFPALATWAGSAEHVRHVWSLIQRREDLRYRKPHTLRHTFASALIQRGEPITYVQKQLGHHSPEFTLKIYGHFIPEGDRRAVDALDTVGGQDARTGPQPRRNLARGSGAKSLVGTGG